MPLDPKTIKVALLAGGDSNEREISLASGKGAAEALRTAGFQVVELDPSKHNDLVSLLNDGYDVAFLCLHGRGGEDGALQGFLETAGLPYTGPGVWSSATAMDKAVSKLIYRAYSIPTPESETLHPGKTYDAADLLARMGDKVVVKPANEGSALGVAIVSDEEALREAVKAAFAIDSAVLVERFISGTELTVAVLGNDTPSVLPVIQIVPQMGDFYDFDSKYKAGGSDHLCPAPIDEATTLKAQALAVAAHQALGCRGMSRSDIMLDENGQLWVLETNTIPGMTSTSLLPDAGRAAGIDFPQLCTMLVEYALED